MSRVMRYNRKNGKTESEHTMKYDAILFDLDGTLLPMDNDVFVKGYLSLLADIAAKTGGYDKELFIKGMWQGVSAMVRNDGSCKNEEVFWKTTAKILGDSIYEQIPVFDAFYSNEFHQAKRFTSPNPIVRDAIAFAREKADKVILATNPLFPTVAVHARMSWVGLNPEDFDWITDYTNSTTCKPNPAYYKEICEKFSLTPDKCLMIGNNAQEDMEAAAAAGIAGFLVKDWLICEGELPDCPQGSFEDLVHYLKEI